jgi:hypothetical protein
MPLNVAVKRFLRPYKWLGSMKWIKGNRSTVKRGSPGDRELPVKATFYLPQGYNAPKI